MIGVNIGKLINFASSLLILPNPKNPPEAFATCFAKEVKLWYISAPNSGANFAKIGFNFSNRPERSGSFGSILWNYF